MILLRARYAGKVVPGILQGSTVHALRGDPFAPRAGRPLALLEAVELLAPVQPSKVLAVGRNYAAHAAEFGNRPPRAPLLFLKPPSAVIGPGEAIVLPNLSREIHHEAELAVVIGRRCRKVRREQAPSFILGYTCANDITARDLQRRDGQWSRAKGFDTFCPLGPWVVTGIDPLGLDLEARVNGEVRQRGNTADLVFPIPALVEYASAVMTLEPGDVLLTGTPAGVGPLHAGDTVEVEIAGIGVLRNPVVQEE